MPEYLAPGVYVEETSFRAKSIEGVSTSTAGFIGPTRFGPTRGLPELVTSFADFQRIYGGMEMLTFGDNEMTNFTAQGVRAFFEEGGSRLYVVRVFQGKDGSDGIATKSLAADPAVPDKKITLNARYPGRAGNMRVTISLKLGLNILATQKINPDQADSAEYNVLRGAGEFDVVWVSSVSGGDGDFYWTARVFEEGRHTFELTNGTDKVKLTALAGKMVRAVTASVATATINERSGRPENENVWQDLGLHPDHPKSIFSEFKRYPSTRSTELYTPLVIEQKGLTPMAVADLLGAQKGANGTAIKANMTGPKPADAAAETDDAAKSGDKPAVPPTPPTPSDAEMTFQVMLDGGNDGSRPETSTYAGEEIQGGEETGRKTGFKALEDIDNISIVAAPGSMYKFATDAAYKPHADAVQRMMIAHCEKMRYRVAILDAADTHLVSEVRAYRAQLDSTYAALYYPWIRSMDPYSGKVINMPPSGFVAGIWARNDTVTGVHKAPANEVVRLAQGFTVMLNKAQQDVLNPEGVNCFRFFEGAGYRLWGARTISSDPEWKYVNLRRYFAFLEQSIEKNTGWAVFMNNSEPLWAKVRQTIEDFLFNEFSSSHLMGSKPDDAYFVRCDRSTMTQNDIDNGRLICLVGVAPVRPAEFVVFRIGQTTAKS